MADEPQRPKPDAESAGNAPPAQAKGPAWWKSLNKKSVTALVAVSLVIHSFGFWYYRAQSEGEQGPPPPEITLGDFGFEAASPPAGTVSAAAFQLHISLLGEVDGPARARLAMRKFKVQQDIEELLRQAHPADFQDPTLTELKRLLAEQINETLGLRAIHEVIITDLVLRRSHELVEVDEVTLGEATPRRPSAQRNVHSRDIEAPPFSF